MNTCDMWNVSQGRGAHSLNGKVPKGLECDNCLENHFSSDCPENTNEATIAKNKMAPLAKNNKIPKGLKCDNCLENHYSSERRSRY